MPKRVLCLLAPGFEEIETLAPVDLLRRAGAEVVMASLTGDLNVTGRCQVTVRADAPLAQAASQAFDMLLIPGGPGVKVLRTDGRAAELAKLFAAQGKPVGAICAAPLVLADAGLLSEKRFTAHFSTQAELPGALAAERVVEDGLLITSRGAGTGIHFGLALVRRLFGEAVEQEVTKAIML